MPLYIADYLAGTAHLSTVEHGAYLLLIMHYWSKGGPPENDEIARRVTRMTNHQWSKSSPLLRTLFCDGWRHKRLDIELEQVAEKSRVASANAHKLHESRRRSASDQHDTITDTTQIQIFSDDGGYRAVPQEQLASNQAANLAKLFLTAAGVAEGSDKPPQWCDVDVRANLWIEAGYPAQMIIRVTKAIAAKSSTNKPLAYFEKAFATALASRQQPLPTPTILPPEKAYAKRKRPGSESMQSVLDGYIDRARANEEADRRRSLREGEGTPRLLPCK
ncbi:DUF1376 domain-containing protein [Tardiphaga sp. vice352]|nr:DUF1376 domain-containing protein [Tardiphaga sp. vice352]